MQRVNEKVAMPPVKPNPHVQNRTVEAEEPKSDDMTMKNNSKIVFVVYGVLVLLGIGTGYLLSKKAGTAAGSTANSASGSIKTDKVVGSTDSTTFKDSAVGVIQKGGASDGEGSHQLIRDGGPSQTVYLISSVVDLDQFAGKKVKVWGQTMAAKNVAWLMDVGKVELQ
jgi:hypothetical protein